MVRHPRFGIGTVRYDAGATVIVRFDDGIEECDKASLSQIYTPLQSLALPAWHSPAEVIARVQAEAIQSTNDTWGVFSRSRIELLPHQLWVCRRVLETWPTHWLVADDVGLGKTIEAGLILWPLLSRGKVRRLLILCPASLVEQWQRRLREMFDIRVARYVADLDTGRSDYWNSQQYVVASLQTLRSNRSGRQERLLDSDPWDLVLVDEAHHLNADEHSGPTLGYRLIEQLVSKHRVQSIVFFTGTPHRGKDYGFWSLLHLLQPNIFDPKLPVPQQLPELSSVMIRNNKQNVTDLKGNRLFYPPRVEAVTYKYTEAETHFYQMLTQFILSGQAYASNLSSTNGRAVMLVLIAMQKLASSSVAAIRRALNKRLAGIVKANEELSKSKVPKNRDFSLRLDEYDNADSAGDIESVSTIEEDVVPDWSGLRLMSDEEPRLRELISAANQVAVETKVREILSILRSQFYGRSVLFFTEYKATQSLIMSALIQEFGETCVTFINGDERAEEVIDRSGVSRVLYQQREDAADKFNSGAARFLISTEAGGEGIDLQEHCHSLIHIDLPWNPMRMHQRVGRLNRYGQKQQVEVISLHNPDTVESLIWDKLNQKIANIMRALQEVMDEPEDLLELVLGMTSTSMFRELFSEAHNVPKDALSVWFDQKTAQFGGKDAVDTVREMIGNVAKFDYQQVSDKIPNSDLPVLKPFIRLMLVLNSRQVREDDSGISFKTPDAWLSDPAVRPSYENLTFDRSERTRDAAQHIVGVGHRAFDQATNQAKNYAASVSTIPSEFLPNPLIVFSITDQVTTETTVVRAIIVGIELRDEGHHALMHDWELLEYLNQIITSRNLRRLRTSGPVIDPDDVFIRVERAQQLVELAMSKLDLPFKTPLLNLLAILWPSTGSPDSITQLTAE
jgi:superfamily II DNA or RNA helicase